MLAIAGAVVVLAVLLLAVLLLARPPGDDSVDAGFARDMSEHHAQAVDMSMEVLQDSQSTDVDVLAYDIATTQSNQIGRMQSWLLAWDLPNARTGDRMAWMPDSMSVSDVSDMDMDMPQAQPGSADYRAMPGMATLAEMEMLDLVEGEEAEILFLQLMITHHLAGADMAQAAVNEADEPEVVQLSETMVAGQRAEIDLMVSMLDDRGAEPREDPAALG